MTGQADTLMPTTPEPDVDVGTRVILVDPRADRRSVMRQMFEHAGVPVSVVGEADGSVDGGALVEQHQAVLAVVDFPSPVSGGIDTVAALRSQFAELTIVVSTFVTDPGTKEQALAAGANAYLVKPVSAREILAAMDTASPGALSGS